MKKSVLILGSGGREHAICWHLAQHSYEAHCSPGSDGISQTAKCWTYDSYEDLLSRIQSENIELVIVGPEALLEEGMADYLEAKGVNCFGPRQSAARLETNKAFAKDFCRDFGIPTAKAQIVKYSSELEEVLRQFAPPYVVKASGLAAGKGVWIGDDRSEALKVGQNFLQKHYSVLVEEFLEGEELSCFYLIDGDHYSFLGDCQDHKRLLDQDAGPNTGGMGAYSPTSLLNPALEEKIKVEVLDRFMFGLKQRQISYRGFLFVGLMIHQNQPLVLEFNCRLGDPETQCLLPRLESSLPELIHSLRETKKAQAELSPQSSASVVVSAKGYPEDPLKGFQLPILKQVEPELLVFHSGTKKTSEGWMANGGRLFSVNALAEDLPSALAKIYPYLEKANEPDKLHYRRDIGQKALKKT